MLETDQGPKCRPPRPLRRTSISPKPLASCITLLPLQSVPIKLRSRPQSPGCEGQQNESLCSTRSSSSAKKIKRSVSLSESNRKLPEIPRAPAVDCSARSWAIADGRTGRLLAGKCEDEEREIASLTKMFTLYTALKLTRELDVSLNAEAIVSVRAATLNGTSANLHIGDRLKLIDVMYGMMLPSGNDAAQCLAEFFGRRLSDYRKIPGMTKDHDRLFLREMNLLCDRLHLRNSSFQNPHGMSLKPNFSTARDVSLLASHALRLAVFRTIVHTRVYSCKLSDKKGQERVVAWENTNKLLGAGYEGVKTGITDAAGPCLCASVKEAEQRIIVTLLGSKSMEERWEEAPRLVAWARTVLPST